MSSMCADVRNKRGTPGLVLYNPIIAGRQYRRWWRDSLDEQYEAAYTQMERDLANAPDEATRMQILEDNK